MQSSIIWIVEAVHVRAQLKKTFTVVIITTWFEEQLVNIGFIANVLRQEGVLFWLVRLHLHVVIADNQIVLND